MSARLRCRSARVLPLLLATLTAALLTAGHAAGFSYFVVNGLPVIWYPPVSLRYLSPSTFPTGSVPEAHILEAMALWNVVPAADFQYNYSPLDQDYPIDHFDGYNDTAAVSASQLDPGVLGVTFLVNNGDVWFDMDILFSDAPLNVGYTFDPNPDCHVVDNPLPSNGFSFLLVAVHELGHALGLGHDPVGNEPAGSPWFIGTMNPAYPSGGPIGQENIIELHTDDRNGLRFLYPPTGPSGPDYVDLAAPGYFAGNTVGLALPATFSPEAVFPQEIVTAQCVLENLGTTSEVFVRQGFYLSDDDLIDTSDAFLGSLTWDIAFQEAFQFGATIPMPDDVAVGDYFLGTIIDDDDGVAEMYEDNNAALYCTPLTIRQRAPQINLISQQVVDCEQAFTGPAPSVALPLNMAPITWSLDNPEPGMTIDPATGVISWPQPVRSFFPYLLIIRATNGEGSDLQTLSLGVNAAVPQIAAVPDQHVSCAPGYVGPAPQVTLTRCMSPIINWSLDSGPPGLAINAGNGRLSWSSPVPSDTPYVATIRAANTAGSGTQDVTLWVRAGDYTGDTHVGLDDAAYFLDCLTGPGGGVPAGCSCGNADADGDIDLRDVGQFQRAFAP